MSGPARSVVFIHGAFMTSLCWEKFIPFFQAREMTCHAPDWPHKNRPVPDLQASPPAGLAGLGVVEIVDHYDRFIRALPQPPVLIGHSFGGLFVQMLLDRGLGAAGVAIDSAPPKGVLPLYPSVLRSLWPVLAAPGGWRRIVRLTREQFAYAFAHTLPAQELDAVYRRYVIPETGRIFFQGALSPFHGATRVTFDNPARAPLLLIAGNEDHVCPPASIRRIYAKQRRARSRTDFLAFDGVTHWLIGQPGWERVAGGIGEWLGRLP